MALVKCKECGSEVSNSAKTCPKCGAPMPKKTSFFTWVVGAFLVAFFYGMISNSVEDKPQKTPEQLQQEKEDKAKNYKALLGAKSIKQSLRDPSSLEFERVAITENNDICYDYRAKNGFGGMNKEYAVLTNKGNFYHNDPDLYNKKCTKVKGNDISALVRAAPL